MVDHQGRSHGSITSAILFTNAYFAAHFKKSFIYEASNIEHTLPYVKKLGTKCFLIKSYRYHTNFYWDLFTSIALAGDFLGILNTLNFQVHSPQKFKIGHKTRRRCTAQVFYFYKSKNYHTPHYSPQINTDYPSPNY